MMQFMLENYHDKLRKILNHEIDDIVRDNLMKMVGEFYCKLAHLLPITDGEINNKIIYMWEDALARIEKFYQTQELLNEMRKGK